MNNATCPQCKESTLIVSCDEFGEYGFCLNVACNYGDEANYMEDDKS